MSSSVATAGRDALIVSSLVDNQEDIHRATAKALSGF
jgi:hypothetical protein